MTTSKEQILSYAAGLFSELSADLTSERDPNNGRFWLRATSQPFDLHVEDSFDEQLLNVDMEAKVRALRDAFVKVVTAGAVTRRLEKPEADPDLAVPVEAKADTDPAPAPESIAEPEQPSA